MATDGRARERGVWAILTPVAAVVAAGLCVDATAFGPPLTIVTALAAVASLGLQMSGRPAVARTLGFLAVLLAGAVVWSGLTAASVTTGMMLTALALAGAILIRPDESAGMTSVVAALLALAGLAHRLA